MTYSVLCRPSVSFVCKVEGESGGLGRGGKKSDFEEALLLMNILTRRGMTIRRLNKNFRTSNFLFPCFSCFAVLFMDMRLSQGLKFRLVL